MSYNHGLEEKEFKERWQKTAEEYPVQLKKSLKF